MKDIKAGFVLNLLDSVNEYVKLLKAFLKAYDVFKTELSDENRDE